jgi:hypothetical protein
MLNLPFGNRLVHSRFCMLLSLTGADSQVSPGYGVWLRRTARAMGA